MMLGALKSRLFRPGEEMRYVRSAFQSLLRRVPRARSLLDVGCGDGYATRLYASTWGLALEDVVGVEPQDKYRAPGHPFRVCAVDIERERLPFPDRSFDVVVCNQVLEHLKTVIAPLREMMRVTQTGGFVAVGIPNLSSLLSRVYLLLGRDPICLAFPGPHVRGLTHRSFGRPLLSGAAAPGRAAGSRVPRTGLLHLLPGPEDPPPARRRLALGALPGRVAHRMTAIRSGQHP